MKIERLQKQVQSSPFKVEKPDQNAGDSHAKLLFSFENLEPGTVNLAT